MSEHREVVEESQAAGSPSGDVTSTPPEPPVVRRHPILRWIPALTLFLLAIVIAMLVHRAADVVRGVAVRGVAGSRADVGAPPVLAPDFPAVTALLLGTSITPGNHVTVLTDLAVYDALFSDIRAARR